MSVKLTPDQVNELCDYIVGSTQFIREGLVAIGLPDVDENDLDLSTLSDIDDRVFLCDECGWTCDVDDRSICDDGAVCQECWEDR